MKATFDVSVDPDALNDSTFTLVKSDSTTLLEAAVTLSAGGKTVTLDPASRLAKRTTYTATIEGGTEGVKDLAANELAVDFSWSFKTKRR